jgi:hypothetical protein
MTTRADLARHLPLDAAVPTKTFVLEVHTPDPDRYLEDLAGPGNVEPTEDAYLSRIPGPADGDLFWVDRLDPRFWIFHTVMPSTHAGQWLHERVESRRDTDWMWLPSDHLRYISRDAVSHKVRTEFDGTRLVGVDEAAEGLKVQLTGTHADRLFDRIAQIPEYGSAVSFDSVEVAVDDPDLGILREAVKCRGSFAASGESFVHHAQFVRAVVDRYARPVEGIESFALRFDPCHPLDSQGQLDEPAGGATYEGAPIGIKFSRQIPDLTRFCAELFSSRAPFRLWGRPVLVDNNATVEAVDLHVGQRLRIDVGIDWIRVHLRAGSCGNSVARLICNLQHRFDSALRPTHHQLADLVTLRKLTSARSG